MTTTREQDFVTFYSPGTLVAEQTRKPIESWDIPAACRMAKLIVERYGARPFAFVFSTDILAEDIDDGRGGKLRVEPKEIKLSGYHHLGGVIRTLADVERDNKPDEDPPLQHARQRDSRRHRVPKLVQVHAPVRARRRARGPGHGGDPGEG